MTVAPSANNIEFLMRPLPHAARKALMATAALVVAGHSAALAQSQITGPQATLKLRNDYFGYGLSVGPRVSYTDNNGLAPNGSRVGEFAGGIASNGSAIYSSNRFTGIIDGSLDVSYLAKQKVLAASQDVGAVGTATIADNLFYVDVGGSSARQLAGDNARFSHNVHAGRNQRVNVHNFTASPYFNRRFGNGSAAEVRYRFGQVFIRSNRNNPTTTLFDRNSQTQEVVATYDSGSMLDKLDFSLTAYGNKSRDYGAVTFQDFEVKQGTLQGDAQYALTDRVAVTGTVGYDDFETNAPTTFIPAAQLTGVFWNAGVHLVPGPKTDIQLQYGRRYDDDFINGTIRYDISQRVAFYASAARTFQTPAQSSATQYQALQRQTLDFVTGLRAGGPSDPSGVINALTRVARQRFNAQQIGFGVSNTVNATLAGNFTNTNVGLHANYRNTNYGFRMTETYSGSLSAVRTLSRKMSAYSDIFYRRVDTTADISSCLLDPALFGFNTGVPGFDPVQACNALVGLQGRTNTVGGRFGLSYRLYQNLSLFGEYQHTERFSQNALLEYGDNAGTIGLQMDF